MVAQTWRPTTEWRIHVYRYDQIIEVILFVHVCVAVCVCVCMCVCVCV